MTIQIKIRMICDINNCFFIRNTIIINLESICFVMECITDLIKRKKMKGGEEGKERGKGGEREGKGRGKGGKGRGKGGEREGKERGKRGEREGKGRGKGG